MHIQKTTAPTNQLIHKKWMLLDARGKTLGRFSAEVAQVLMGKTKPYYSPNTDTGDNVVVINAEKIYVTGRKLKEKLYKWHTGYPGALKSTTLDKLMVKAPTRALHKSIAGMLPKNKLGKQLLTKLHIYAGENHPHTAQVK